MLWPIVKMTTRKLLVPAAIVVALAATVVYWGATLKELVGGGEGTASLADLGPFRSFYLGVLLVVVLIGVGRGLMRASRVKKIEQTLVPQLEQTRDAIVAFRRAHGGRYPTTADTFGAKPGAARGNGELVVLTDATPLTFAGRRVLAAPRKPLRGPFGARAILLMEDGTIEKSDNTFRVELFYSALGDALRDRTQVPDFAALGRAMVVPPVAAVLFVFFLTPFIPGASGRLVWNGPKFVAGLIVAVLGYFWLEGAFDFIAAWRRRKRMPMWTIVATAVPYAFSAILAIGALRTFMR